MMKTREKADIYRDIRQMILNGEMSPGDRLKEVELARKFGLSRTPVREALHRLEVQGLLRHEPHRGMVIPTLDPQAVTELYVMREVLEGTAAALAAQHATDVEIKAMTAIVAHDQLHPNDGDRLAGTNRAFHGAIHRAAHNRFLMQSLQSLDESNALLGPTTLKLEARREKAINEHQRIIAAIRARDAAKAETAMRQHLRSAFAARLAVIDTAISGHSIPAAPDETGTD